jgi:hypothetical protein
MTTKNSRENQALKGSEEALSPLETLLSGKAGPLPLDNDQRMPQQNADLTSNEMRSSAREKTSGPFLSGIKQQIMKDYPDLTEKELDAMLAET